MYSLNYTSTIVDIDLKSMVNMVNMVNILLLTLCYIAHMAPSIATIPGGFAT